MHKHLSNEDEELYGITGQLLNLHTSHRERISHGEEVTLEEFKAVADLSRRHAELMKASKSSTCSACGEEFSKEKASFLIVRDIIIYDESIGGPRLVPLPQEIYTQVRCPDCMTQDIMKKLGLG